MLLVISTFITKNLQLRKTDVNGCCLFVAGVRAVHFNRNTSDVTCGIRDRSRLHIRHQEAAANDHIWGRQGANPDMPQFTRPLPVWLRRGPANVCHRLRGDWAFLQHRRRRTESKTVGVSEPSFPCTTLPTAPLPSPSTSHDDSSPPTLPDPLLQSWPHAGLRLQPAVP